MIPFHILIEAIKANDLQQVTDLLDEDPALIQGQTESGLSALMTALYHGKNEIAWTLADRTKVCSIFEAAAMGRLDLVREIVDQEPEQANAIARDGFQPLGLSSYFGHEEVVRYLIEKGAEVNAPSKNMQRVTPLHSAVAGCHLEIAHMLLHNGANPNMAQTGGYTPLHGAAQNGQLELVQLLLEHGANVDAEADDGNTPLSLAVEREHVAVIELLRRVTGARLAGEGS
jgi:ankyrin repeat protein